MASTYTVYARNAALEYKGTIPYLGLSVTPVYCGVGSWQLTLPLDSPKAALLQPGWGVVILDDGTGQVIMSGPVRDITAVEAEASGTELPRDTLTVSGVSDDFMLYARNAYPTPANTVTNQTSVVADVRTGDAETVLREYVNLNAGPGARVERRIFGLTLETNLNRGDTVKASARFDILSDLITAQVAVPGGIGWRVVQTEPGAIKVKVFEPTDRSGTVRFSRALGNLRSATWKLTGPASTVAVVAGQGVGTARTFREQNNATAESDWGMRVERFGDRRDSGDNDTLDQAGLDILAKDGPQTSLELAPIDTPKMRFGEHYFLGDIVEAVVHGETVTDVVRQVVITVTADRTDVVPLVGSDGATNPSMPRIYAAVQTLIRKMAGLETRQ